MVFCALPEALAAAVQQLGQPCHREHKRRFERSVCDAPQSERKLNWWPETGALRLAGDPVQPGAVERRLAEPLSS